MLGVLFFSPPAALRLLLALPLALGLLLLADLLLPEEDLLLPLFALGLLLRDGPDLDEEEDEELRVAMACSLCE